jgi:signal transduction histidine kinase
MTSIRKRLVIWLLLGLSLLWVTAGAGIYYSVHRGELARLDAKLYKLDGPIRFMTNMIPRHMLSDDIKSPLSNPDRGDIPPREQRPQREDRALREETRSRVLTERWENFSQESGYQFQIWKSDGTTVLKSPNLGDHNLNKPSNVTPGKPQFFALTGDDDTPMRAMAITFRPKGFGGLPRQRGSDPGRRAGLPPQDAPGRRAGAPQDTPGRRPGTAPQDTPRFPYLTAMITVDANPMQQTLSNLLLGITGIGILAAFGSITLIHFALKNGLKPLDNLGNKVALIDASSLDDRFSSDDLPRELTPICNHLNALMGRLEDSFERERRFSSNLAHELRTPIAELRMMSEVALRWPEEVNSEQVKETLEIAEQMQGIIESLLTLGRYENGQAEITPETVEIAGLGQACWKPFADRAAAKNIEVHLEIPETQTLDTDPQLLRLIFTNLFSNATEYTPSEGLIHIAGSSGMNGTVISVTNTASNLDAESVSHLFERFWRQDDARTDSRHCGLGLALARTCSEALALDLRANLEDGNRIVFKLTKANQKKIGTSSSGNIDPLAFKR